MATVTAIATVHRRGQTFLTFTKNAGAGGGTTYAVRRDTSQITSSSQGTLIATLDADSWHYLYDDTGYTPRLSNGFKIPATAGETGVASRTLASTEGLLVWTTASGGNYYYGVFTSDDPTTVSAGSNTTTSATVETAVSVPGAALIGTSGSNYQYFRWEDYASWRTADWGYYGHHVGVYSAGGSNLAIVVHLHSAVTDYQQPPATGSPLSGTIQIVPHDFHWVVNTDPYTGTQYIHSGWSGRLNSSSGHFVPITERRVAAYAQMVRDSATGEGTTFNVDGGRIYLEGASHGSAGGHIAAHYPTLFAAYRSSLPYFSAEQGRGALVATNTVVDVSGSPTFGNWFAMHVIAQTVAIPPGIITYNKDDQTVLPWQIPEALTAFEASMLAYVCQWKDGNHSGFDPGAVIDTPNTIGGGLAWDLLRFRRTESYPAFANLSTSDAVGTLRGNPNYNNATGDPGNAGQRNYWLDWQSSLHTITGGSAISDTASSYAISLLSRNGTVTTDVTIRNAQAFAPTAASWSTNDAQSGSATVQADGSVTVAGLTLGTSALRLTLTATSGFGGVFSGVVR